MDYKEKLKAIINSNKTPFSDIDTFLKYFPELAESEDERIRKELTEFLKSASEGFLDTTIQCKTFGKWLTWFEKQGEQKPADNIDKPWSEDDNKHFERILKELKNQWQRPSNRPYLDEIVSDYYWLESLKNRVQPKQEWNEEDEEMFNEIILDLKALKNRDTGEAGKAAYQREIDWLESLKPQSQWKPSEEQMKALEVAIRSGIQLGSWEEDSLKSLARQLMKLRKE